MFLLLRPILVDVCDALALKQVLHKAPKLFPRGLRGLIWRQKSELVDEILILVFGLGLEGIDEEFPHRISIGAGFAKCGKRLYAYVPCKATYIEFSLC